MIRFVACQIEQGLGYLSHQALNNQTESKRKPTAREKTLFSSIDSLINSVRSIFCVVDDDDVHIEECVGKQRRIFEFLKLGNLNDKLGDDTSIDEPQSYSQQAAIAEGLTRIYG